MNGKLWLRCNDEYGEIFEIKQKCKQRMKAKKQTGKSEKKGKKLKVAKGLARAKNQISTRGRTFKGTVIRKFPGRVTIEFERTVNFSLTLFLGFFEANSNGIEK